MASDKSDKAQPLLFHTFSHIFSESDTNSCYTFDVTWLRKFESLLIISFIRISFWAYVDKNQFSRETDVSAHTFTCQNRTGAPKQMLRSVKNDISTWNYALSKSLLGHCVLVEYFQVKDVNQMISDRTWCCVYFDNHERVNRALTVLKTTFSIRCIQKKMLIKREASPKEVL